MVACGQRAALARGRGLSHRCRSKSASALAGHVRSCTQRRGPTVRGACCRPDGCSGRGARTSQMCKGSSVWKPLPLQRLPAATRVGCVPPGACVYCAVSRHAGGQLHVMAVHTCVAERAPWRVQSARARHNSALRETQFKAGLAAIVGVSDGGPRVWRRRYWAGAQSASAAPLHSIAPPQSPR